jgi:ABC-2 type transport system ATP-binding protein
MVAPRKQTDPVIAVQALTKTFKDFWLRARARAVDNVSFEVYPGEIFGLLGPNGSGKSTTIKIMLGLLKQTSGRIAVFGKPPSDVAVKKRIGYLPEESYLYPFLNARETLDYYGKLFKLERGVRQRRTDELLDMVGLSAVQYRPVREYSKGMQRRIGIAQALINDPELLILDEPTSGLDPIGTRQVKDLILELGRRGKTILLSSHLLADVEDCVSRMVILYGGKIQEEGTCDQLLESQDRSIFETDTLDEATIAEIDRIVRERTGKSIGRVTRPRQKLEDKFVSIVERAIERRVETAGARHDGKTADFLRAETGPTGDALIQQLVTRDTAPTPAPAPAAPAAPAGPDTSAIAELVKPAAPAPAPAAASKTDAQASKPAVDDSVISSLLGEGPSGPGKSGGAS